MVSCEGKHSDNGTEIIHPHSKITDRSGIRSTLLRSWQALAVANYERGSFQTQAYVLR